MHHTTWQGKQWYLILRCLFRLGRHDPRQAKITLRDTESSLRARWGFRASAFVNDGEFRTQLRQLIKEEVAADFRDEWLLIVPGTGESVDRSRYRVTYVVLANSSCEGRDWLPFFSKLNLMQQGRQLATMGLSVTITRVPITDPLD